MSDTPTQITADQQLSVTLSIMQWREVLERLAAPIRPAQALIADIEKQCNAELQRIAPMPQRGNGKAEERPDA